MAWIPWVIVVFVFILLLYVMLCMLGKIYSYRQMVIALSDWIKDNSDKPLQAVWEECYGRAAQNIKESDYDSKQELLRKQLRGVWRAL